MPGGAESLRGAIAGSTFEHSSFIRHSIFVLRHSSFPVHATYIIFLFLLGSCIGSFLNVVVWRLPRGESLVTPPSHCPKCGKNLKWYDNLPIIGWIKLSGKCRFCRE